MPGVRGRFCSSWANLQKCHGTGNHLAETVGASGPGHIAAVRSVTVDIWQTLCCPPERDFGPWRAATRRTAGHARIVGPECAFCVLWRGWSDRTADRARVPSAAAVRRVGARCRHSPFVAAWATSPAYFKAMLACPVPLITTGSTCRYSRATLEQPRALSWQLYSGRVRL
jgi:hypothetical protein